jgi:hypothetical protein
MHSRIRTRSGARAGLAACLLAGMVGTGAAEPTPPRSEVRGWIELAIGKGLLRAHVNAWTINRYPWNVEFALGGVFRDRFAFGVAPWLQSTLDGELAIGAGANALVQYRIEPLVFSARAGWARWMFCCGFAGDSDSKARTSTIPVGISAAYFRGIVGVSLDAMMGTTTHDEFPSVSGVFALGVSVRLHGVD